MFLFFIYNPFETGSVDKGVVEVTNCFCVPHKEHDDQVEAELSYALDVYDLNRRVNPSESIVGKYIEKCEIQNCDEFRLKFVTMCQQFSLKCCKKFCFQ